MLKEKIINLDLNKKLKYSSDVTSSLLRNPSMIVSNLSDKAPSAKFT